MDSGRIRELQRRVEADPASIAFAQLAEEYRRAGNLRQAVDMCHAGLAKHPEYTSARVTLGRALLELDDLDRAEAEMRRVLSGSPDNLSAIRALAEIHRRRGLGEESGQPVPSAQVRTVRPAAPVVEWSPEPPAPSRSSERDRGVVAALEAWLAAIHVARADRHA
jgi:Tfp pilus assembly protein PilF